MSDETNFRNVPVSGLDFNMQMIRSKWGKDDVLPKGLKDKLSKTLYQVDSDGKLVTDDAGNFISSEKDLWSLLGAYTEDLRLGNLDNKVDIPYCEHYLNLANDLLKENFVEPFLIALSKVATRLELSQSKNGFLRRRPNTIETQKTEKTVDSRSRSFMRK